MTTIQVLKKEKEQVKLIKVTDCYFYYTSVGKNKKVVFSQKDLPKSRHTQFEWTTDVLVSEDTADELQEMFPKISVTKLTRKKFMERYKIENDADIPSKDTKLYIVKVKQGCQKQDGTPVSDSLKSRAVLVGDKGNTDITVKANIGNGSFGDLVIRVNVSANYGQHGYLAALLIKDLVEYESGGEGGLFNDLGLDVELDEIPDDAPVQTSKADEVDEDDVPFDVDEDDVY